MKTYVVGTHYEYPQHVFMEKYENLSLNYHQIPTVSVSLIKNVWKVRNGIKCLERVQLFCRDCWPFSGTFISQADLSCLVTKPTKWHVRPEKTGISLSTRPVWSEFWLSAWRVFGSIATHWAHSENTDQTGQMSRLIWVFAGGTVIWLFCHEAAHLWKNHTQNV